MSGADPLTHFPSMSSAMSHELIAIAQEKKAISKRQRRIHSWPPHYPDRPRRSDMACFPPRGQMDILYLLAPRAGAPVTRRTPPTESRDAMVLAKREKERSRTQRLDHSALWPKWQQDWRNEPGLPRQRVGDTMGWGGCGRTRVRLRSGLRHADVWPKSSNHRIWESYDSRPVSETLPRRAEARGLLRENA